MFKKCILILAASCMMYSCATQTESNPFLTEFQTPNGVPPFDKIKLEHYEPAFQKGIEEQNANIQAIIDNTEALLSKMSLLPSTTALPPWTV